jgi:hypothetical protein
MRLDRRGKAQFVTALGIIDSTAKRCLNTKACTEHVEVTRRLNNEFSTVHFPRKETLRECFLSPFLDTDYIYGDIWHYHRFSTRISHETLFCHRPSLPQHSIGDVISREHNICSQQGWFCLNMVVAKVRRLKMMTPLLQQEHLVCFLQVH